MSTQIKPGTMCYVRGNNTQELNGRIVTVIEKVTDITEKYLSNCGRYLVNGITPTPSYLCSSSSPLPWNLKFGSEKKTYYFDKRPIAASTLVPISDPDIDVSDDVHEILELEGVI